MKNLKRSWKKSGKVMEFKDLKRVRAPENQIPDSKTTHL